MKFGFEFLEELESTPRGKKNLEKFSILFKDISGMCFLFLPREIYESKGGKLATLFLTLAFYADDAVEETGMLGDAEISRIPSLIKTLVELFRGDSGTERPALPPFFEPLERAMSKTLAELRETLPHFITNQDFFFDGLSRFLLGVGVVVKAENNPEIEMSDYLHEVVRINDGGGMVTAEFLAAVSGLTIPKDIRSNFLFQEAQRLFEQIFSEVNDIVSLVKELGQGKGRSPIGKTAQIRGITLEEALEYVSKKSLSHLQEFKRISALLRQLYPDSDEMDSYLLLCGRLVDAGGHLCRHTMRYKGAHIYFNFKGEE